LTRSTNYGWALAKKSFSHAAAVRMTDVARRAGVSSATVSRVLNGRGNVATAYRRRVVDAVEELGYRPNRLAQNLRYRRALVADQHRPTALIVSNNMMTLGAMRAVHDAGLLDVDLDGMGEI